MSEALLVASEHEIVLFVFVIEFLCCRRRFLLQVEYLFHHDYPSFLNDIIMIKQVVFYLSTGQLVLLL